MRSNIHAFDAFGQGCVRHADARADVFPQVIGRAVQLGVGHAASVLLADAVVAFTMARQVSCIRWVNVREGSSEAVEQ